MSSKYYVHAKDAAEIEYNDPCNELAGSGNYATNIHFYLQDTSIYSAPPNIPMNDSKPGLCDTLSREAIARSYPSSNW